MVQTVRHIPGIALVLAMVAALAFGAAPAYAANVEQLGMNYRAAVQAYEAAVVEREQNAGEITELEGEIEQVDEQLARTRDSLGKTAGALYKESSHRDSLIELLFTSSSFSEAVQRYDLYKKVQDYYAERAHGYAEQEAELQEQRSELEARKTEIESRVTEAKQVADDAEQALLGALHTDGAKYHQVQGNKSNCGATAFTVGVNILLHDERFKDNVKVWEGAGFQRNSTVNLAQRGKAWLLANDLSDKIGIEEVPGDIHTTEALREQLEAGNVVVISSGDKSIWQRADGTETEPGAFPSGHWIVFYHYEEGFFLANDSSVLAAKGAGVAYSEEQMKQWLDGRSYHFATVLYTK